MSRDLLVYVIVALALSLSQVAWCIEKQATELEEVGVTTKLGTQVDFSLRFVNENGESGTLREFVRADRPIVLVPAYYGCPRLCGLVLQGVQELLDRLTLTLGSDFQLITVSFDPSDTPALARERAQTVYQALKDPELARRNWRFLTGPQESIQPLMRQIGFNYKPDHGEFAHGAAIMILTPTGQISQYFTGIEYSPFDIRLALVEASKGGIGSPLDHIMLFCFRFDETRGKYTWAAYNLVRAGGLLTFLFLSGLLIALWRRERAVA